KKSAGPTIRGSGIKGPFRGAEGARTVLPGARGVLYGAPRVRARSAKGARIFAFSRGRYREFKSPESSRQQDANLTWRLEFLAQVQLTKRVASGTFVQKVSTRVALASWRLELLGRASPRRCGERKSVRGTFFRRWRSGSCYSLLKFA